MRWIWIQTKIHVVQTWKILSIDFLENVLKRNKSFFSCTDEKFIKRKQWIDFLSVSRAWVQETNIKKKFTVHFHLPINLGSNFSWESVQRISHRIWLIFRKEFCKSQEVSLFFLLCEETTTFGLIMNTKISRVNIELEWLIKCELYCLVCLILEFEILSRILRCFPPM